MRLTTSGDVDVDESLCSLEDRLELLAAAVAALADFDSDGPPTTGTMRGLAATLDEMKAEVNAIANAIINEANAAYDREHPELAKLIARGRGKRAPAESEGAR